MHTVSEPCSKSGSHCFNQRFATTPPAKLPTLRSTNASAPSTLHSPEPLAWSFRYAELLGFSCEREPLQDYCTPADILQRCSAESLDSQSIGKTSEKLYYC